MLQPNFFFFFSFSFELYLNYLLKFNIYIFLIKEIKTGHFYLRKFIYMRLARIFFLQMVYIHEFIALLKDFLKDFIHIFKNHIQGILPIRIEKVIWNIKKKYIINFFMFKAKLAVHF